MKYYFGFIALVILLFIGAKLIFSTPKKSTNRTSVTTSSNKQLSDYADTNAEVAVTVEGPIVGNELHHAIRITISGSKRNVDIIEGYSGVSVQHNSFDNNTDAYRAFLHAIDLDGFLKSQKPQIGDDAGVCPTGSKYVYTLDNTGDLKNDKRLWSVSCSITIGTAAGSGPAIRDLFQKQVPDYDTLTKGINVYPPAPKNGNSALAF
jgi:hypothetical protein